MSYFPYIPPYYSGYPYYSPYYYGSPYRLYNDYKLNGLLNEYSELNDVAAQNNATYIQNLISNHREFHVGVVQGKDKEIENLHNELKKHDIAIPEFSHDISLNPFDMSMNKDIFDAKEKGIKYYNKPHWAHGQYWPYRPHWPYGPHRPHWPYGPYWKYDRPPYLFRDIHDPSNNSPPVHPHIVIPHAVSPHVVTKFLPNIML